MLPAPGRYATFGGSVSKRPDVPVTVATCYGYMEAGVVQSKLRACGIESWRAHEAVGYVTTVDGLGAIDILVSGSDAQRALDILSDEEDCPD